jgi:hypothetical protein
MNHTKIGAAATPITQVNSKAQNKTVATASMSARVAASPWRVLDSANKGTKACENAPSANKRRNKFGMRNAT